MDDDFLMEVHRLAIELELLIDKYDMRDSVLSMMVVGVLEAMEEEDDNVMLPTPAQERQRNAQNDHDHERRSREHNAGARSRPAR